MKKIIFMSVFLALVLGSCQKATETTPTIDPASLIETMMATIQGEPTPTAPEGTPVPNTGPNPEQIAKLKEGKDAWNLWRTQNPDVIPFLVNVDLQEVDLTLCNLVDANLIGADLQNANLRRTDLRRADLNRTDLVGANLTGAKLNKSDMTFADMTDVKLINAILTSADLRNAILTNAKYSDKTKWP